VAVVVRETVRAVARDRFERGIEARVRSLGSTVTAIVYAADADGVLDHLGRLTRGSERVDVVLTAGAASTDPTDPFFVAIERLGGGVVRHGVPAHPGSMVWLARIRATDLLGLPTCGAYSKATAADLLLPRLLTGERASSRIAASLGHGGVLIRAMRFRFPAYARHLDAPVGGSWVGPAEAIK
jgi:molybdopterin biosynthesis enzyme